MYGLWLRNNTPCRLENVYNKHYIFFDILKKTKKVVGGSTKILDLDIFKMSKSIYSDLELEKRLVNSVFAA
jgi:hypothetical protein